MIVDTGDVWNLVERARDDLGERAADADAVAQRMVALPAQREPADIVAFGKALWELLSESYRADLWAAAYVINGGASDDGFDYFRGWLIAQGREVFRQALADPDGLAGYPPVIEAAAAETDLWSEDLLSVPWNAHRVATRRDPPAGTPDAGFPALDPDWDFDFDDEDEMRRRLPRLTELFFGPTGT
jgi:hypothetical protein